MVTIIRPLRGGTAEPSAAFVPVITGSASKGAICGGKTRMRLTGQTVESTYQMIYLPKMSSVSKKIAKGPILNRSLRLRKSRPRLPDQFQAQLDRTVCARPKDRIGRRLIGRVTAAPEGA